MSQTLHDRLQHVIPELQWQVNSRSNLGEVLCTLDNHPSPVLLGDLDGMPVVGCDHEVGVQIECVWLYVLVLKLHCAGCDYILDLVVLNKQVLCLVDLHTR